MNKKIEELSSRAWYYAYQNSSDGDDQHGILYTEKLAELIIKECIAVHVDDYGVDIIGNVLKKHFGVKE